MNAVLIQPTDTCFTYYAKRVGLPLFDIFNNLTDFVEMNKSRLKQILPIEIKNLNQKDLIIVKNNTLNVEERQLFISEEGIICTINTVRRFHAMVKEEKGVSDFASEIAMYIDNFRFNESEYTEYYTISFNEILKLLKCQKL